MKKMEKRRKYKYKAVSLGNRSCILPQNSNYSLVYNKGSIVKASSDTLGIMVFETRKNAEDFISTGGLQKIGLQKIKKVIPIGRGRRPKLVSWTITDSNLESFYSGIDLSLVATRRPPKGTICYPAVEVVD